MQQISKHHSFLKKIVHPLFGFLAEFGNFIPHRLFVVGDPASDLGGCAGFLREIGVTERPRGVGT